VPHVSQISVGYLVRPEAHNLRREDYNIGVDETAVFCLIPERILKVSKLVVDIGAEIQLIPALGGIGYDAYE
jgi:hypothetical protein